MKSKKLCSLLGILGATLSPMAHAAISSPACPELVKLGQEIAPGQVVPINDTPSRFTLPAVFAGPRVQQVYGAPTLTWTAEDVAAAIKQAADCGTTAKKDKKAADIQALTALYQTLGAVRSTVGAVAATGPKIDAGLKTLLEDAPSRGGLDALIVLASVRNGGPEAAAKVAKDLKDSSVRLNAWEPVHTHAQNFFATLRDAPTASWGRVFPPIDKRVVEVRQWVMEDATAKINATPENLQGLAALDPLMKKNQAELTASLSDADMAKIKDAATTRRGTIETALLTQETARLDALPANADGLNQLRAAQTSPIKAALSTERVATLDKRIADRREAIGTVVTDAQIKQLDQYPATMAGLTDLNTFKVNTARGLETLAGSAAASRFSEAAAKRSTNIAEASLPPFEKALADMPATDQGLSELDSALKQITAPIQSLEPAIRQRYVDAAGKRREQIVAAVEKQDAELAKLPLPGAVYIDPEIDAKIEFRNASRLYLTMFKQTTEAGYEVDGERLIIQLPTGNQVLTKKGAWLRGSDVNFKRQVQK